MGNAPRPNADPAAEIRRLYYEATPRTIARDLACAIDLFKRLTTEDERQHAAVYMDGLSQLRSEWAATRGRREAQAGSSPRTPGTLRPPDSRSKRR